MDLLAAGIVALRAKGFRAGAGSRCAFSGGAVAVQAIGIVPATVSESEFVNGPGDDSYTRTAWQWQGIRHRQHYKRELTPSNQCFPFP